MSHTKRIAASALIVLAMYGCSTVNPYTQEKQTSKAAKGAGIGAAAGGIGGLLYDLMTRDKDKK